MAVLTVATKKLSMHSHATFLRPSVRMVPLTQAIVDAIMPFFPLSCKVIGGYLDEGDQYWKVNYHWENLVTRIETFRAMDEVDEKYKAMALHVWKVLMTVPPLPERGYLADKQVGATKDATPWDKIRERHKLLKQAKKDFRQILIAAGVVDAVQEKGNPPKADKPWWLAVAPLAAPGTSKHGTGYALDISGDNTEIKRLCSALGASLVFNEASHVHVEFAKGVNAPVST